MTKYEQLSGTCVQYKARIETLEEKCLDYRRKISKLESKNKWTPCNEGLPDYDKYVLWKYDNGFVFEGCIGMDDDVSEFLKGNDASGHIVSWMEVPE